MHSNLTTICPHCGREFTQDPTKQKPRRYCSASCGARGWKRLTSEERFWKYTDKSGGPDACWLWTGWKTTAGYGMLQDNGRDRGAHRFSYELVHGPIPHSMLLLHKCDNPSCVNPSHLAVGTQQDNIDDMWAKGRGAAGDKHWCSLHPERIARGEHQPLAKLTEANVREIRRLRERGEPLAGIAARFGVTPTTACAIARRKSWKHVA